MKKAYESPMVEQVKFQYREQVVAASGETCNNLWTHEGAGECKNQIFVRNYLG